MDTELVTTSLMTPELANFSGNVHGGHILRLVDQIAYACASQYAGKYCVTLSVDRVVFKVPVRVGDLLTMKAKVNYTGRTSLQVGVRVEARDLKGGEARHTNTCYLTMVAMDDGRPAAVPAFSPKTNDEKRRFIRAQLAREQGPALDRMATSVHEYHAMMDLAAVPILLVDAKSGLIRLANRRVCELLGRKEESLEHQPVWQLYAESDRHRARAHSAHVETDGLAPPVVFAHLTGSGSEITLRVTSWLIPLPTQPLIQHLLQPY
jgi:PAS domain S-box-containing protein